MLWLVTSLFNEPSTRALYKAGVIDEIV